MHEHDGHGALADGGGDPLGRLGARVAGHEHAGHAGLQVVRRPVQLPARPAAARRRSGRARPGRSPRSSRSTVPSSQSVSGAAPMNTNSHCASTSSVCAARPCRAASAAPGGPSPCAASTTVPGAHGDVRRLVDLLDQVVRHRRGQGLARGPAASPTWRPGPGTPRPARPSWRRRRCTRPGPGRPAASVSAEP